MASNTSDAQHLLESLQVQYNVTADWAGTKFCGVPLAWDYEAGTVDLSLPGYVAKSLLRLKHAQPTHACDALHAWQEPVYGQKFQMATPTDESPPSDKAGIKLVEEAVGIFMY